MLKELIKSLNEAKAEVETLEAKVEKGLKQALATIHADHGFDSVSNFLKAVKKASKKAEVKGKKAATRAFPQAKRAKITAAVRATVKNLVKAGKSGTEIAKAVGISAASVQNVKKALGLVKQAKKKGPRKVAAKRKAWRATSKGTATGKTKKNRATSKKAASASPVAAPAATAAPAAPLAQ
jgi:phosphopantothenoylcysteine synthetase/decarboxylase